MSLQLSCIHLEVNRLHENYVPTLFEHLFFHFLRPMFQSDEKFSKKVEQIDHSMVFWNTVRFKVKSKRFKVKSKALWASFVILAVNCQLINQWRNERARSAGGPRPLGGPLTPIFFLIFSIFFIFLIFLNFLIFFFFNPQLPFVFKSTERYLSSKIR